MFPSRKFFLAAFQSQLLKNPKLLKVKKISLLFENNKLVTTFGFFFFLYQKKSDALVERVKTCHILVIGNVLNFSSKIKFQPLLVGICMGNILRIVNFKFLSFLCFWTPKLLKKCHQIGSTVKFAEQYLRFNIS
jgi:hypothetical protein